MILAWLRQMSTIRTNSSENLPRFAEWGTDSQCPLSSISISGLPRSNMPETTTAQLSPIFLFWWTLRWVTLLFLVESLFSSCIFQFDFKTYLQAIYRLGNVTMKDTDRIIVSELDVLRNVSMIIHQERPRILQNYLVGRFVMSQLDFLPKRFRLLKQEFIKVFYGIGIEGSRSFSCAKYVTRNMGLAVAKLYISKYFDKDARQEVSQ